MSSPDQLDEDQMAVVRQQAWMMFEEQIFGWFDQLRTQTQTRKVSEWKNQGNAQQLATQIEDAGNTEEALRKAFGDIQRQLMLVVIRYVQQHQNPSENADPLKEEIRALLRELHNPESMEVLMLAVKPEYRDHVRDRFDEIGSVFWGLIDLAMGNESDDLWFLIEHLAQFEEAPLDEILRNVDGVSLEDFPDQI